VTIEELGNLGEFIASIAVLVTLVYVSAQVRQANLHATMAARQRMVEHSQTELYKLIDDPRIHEAMTKESLSETEQAMLSFFLTAAMRQREFEWLQYEDGILDEKLYRAYQVLLGVHLGTLRTRRWWKSVGRSAFDSTFVAEVDRYLEQSPLSTYQDDIRHYDDPARADHATRPGHAAG